MTEPTYCLGPTGVISLDEAFVTSAGVRVMTTGQGVLTRGWSGHLSLGIGVLIHEGRGGG